MRKPQAVEILDKLVQDIVMNYKEVMNSRDQQLGDHKPASTLVVVPELAKEEWKMEIAVVAVK